MIKVGCVCRLGQDFPASSYVCFSVCVCVCVCVRSRACVYDRKDMFRREMHII